MKFTKMQGCGNDYIYIDGSRERAADKAELARRLSDRHFGIGGDGVIWINLSETADFEMEMYNADGSRGRMCGNGIRCVAKYVYEKGLTKKNPLTIESFGAVKTLFLTVTDGKVEKVRVDMGEPVLEAARIPVSVPETLGKADEEGRIIDVPILVRGKECRITAVSMGNPHAIVFVPDPEEVPLESVGSFHEHHPAFPEGVNTEFVRVLDRRHLQMRVWERGSGETLACGTGACAALAAAVLTGRTDRRASVGLRGGELEIEWSEEDGHIYMTGPAEIVFEGEVPRNDG